MSPRREFAKIYDITLNFSQNQDPAEVAQLQGRFITVASTFPKSPAVESQCDQQPRDRQHKPAAILAKIIHIHLKYFNSTETS